MMDNSYAGTKSRGIFIDCEADMDCNAVEIAIVDETGMPVYVTPIKPLKDQGFLHARKQLPQRLLNNAPTLLEVTPIIEEISANKTCFFWNAPHDLKCLPNCFSRAKNVVCAMERFALLNGEFSMWHGTYNYVSLEQAMVLLSLDWPKGVRHRAVTDAEALRRVWKWLDTTSIQSLLRNAELPSVNNNGSLF